MSAVPSCVRITGSNEIWMRAMTDKTPPMLKQEQATERSGRQNHGEDGELLTRPEGPELDVSREQEPMGVREWHVREDFLDPVQLLRSIQRAEGNPDCFRRRDICEEFECAWRPYCISDPCEPA